MCTNVELMNFLTKNLVIREILKETCFPLMTSISTLCINIDQVIILTKMPEKQRSEMHIILHFESELD